MSSATLRRICGSAAVLIFCVLSSDAKAPTSRPCEAALASPEAGASAAGDGDAGVAAGSGAAGVAAEAGAGSAYVPGAAEVPAADMLDAGAAAMAVPAAAAF